MIVAAVYDIHANLPALDAVLSEIRGLEPDLVVVGGDVVPGPMPRETIERLESLDVPVKFIFGNGEVAILEMCAGRTPAGIPEQVLPRGQWNADQLSTAQQEFVASWPKTVELEVPGLGRVLFCHATPRSEDEIFTRLTSEAALAPIFEGLEADVVVCGHTHMQFDRSVGRVRVVNAGSVGMPFGTPGADWLLLGPGVEFRHTPYDLASAAAAVRDTGFVGAEQFAEESILRPPSEESMLEIFTRAGVR